MDPAVLVALIGGGVAIAVTSINAFVSLYTLTIVHKVQRQTDGLLADAEKAATARGKVSGIAEGKQQGLDKAAADRSRE